MYKTASLTLKAIFPKLTDGCNYLLQELNSVKSMTMKQIDALLYDGKYR